MAKLRTNNWIQCQYFQYSIEKTDNALCKTCNVLDDAEHVINKCKIHIDPRQIMLPRLKHPGKVTELLASKEQNIIKELAKFLVEVRRQKKRDSQRKQGKCESVQAIQESPES